MMDTIALIANIAQILSFLWLIVLGSKTIFDVIRHRNFRVSILFVANIVLTLIVIFLSFALLSYSRAYSSNASISVKTKQIRQTPSYTVTVLDTPQLPVTIPCKVSCASKLNVTITKFFYENTPVSLTFALTNNDVVGCSMTTKELTLIDATGRVWDGDGQVDVVGYISPGQTLYAIATFQSITINESHSPYSLHMVLACNSSEAMIYQVEQFFFLQVEPSPTPIIANTTVQATFALFCIDIHEGNYEGVYQLFSSDLQRRISKADNVNTFAHFAFCKVNPTALSFGSKTADTATGIVIFTTFADTLDHYKFYLQYENHKWEIQSWEHSS